MSLHYDCEYNCGATDCGAPTNPRRGSASARLPLLCGNNLRSENMPFAELTKPRASWSFWIWKVLVDINFARTWTWCDQTEWGKERVTRLVSLHIVQREIEGKVQSAFTLILGPLKVMVGLAT